MSISPIVCVMQDPLLSSSPGSLSWHQYLPRLVGLFCGLGRGLPYGCLPGSSRYRCPSNRGG